VPERLKLHIFQLASKKWAIVTTLLRSDSGPSTLSLVSLRLALAIGLLVVGCGAEAKGTGETCVANDDCASGLCVAGIDGEGAICAKSCAGDDECPEGFSCGAVTGQGVVVCRRGAATPLGR
jgi:hypothetical protein